MLFFLASHFANPKGPLGRGLGLLMSIVNRPLARWTVALVNPGPGEQVLEIGCGPGVALQELAARRPQTRVVGVDHSAVMIRQAAHRNSRVIRGGKAALHQATVSRLPFRDAQFNRVFSINSVQYWPDLGSALQEIRRVLRPGGSLHVVLRPRWAHSELDVIAVADRLAAGLLEAGFARIDRGYRPNPRLTTLFVTGSAPVPAPMSYWPLGSGTGAWARVSGSVASTSSPETQNGTPTPS